MAWSGRENLPEVKWLNKCDGKSMAVAYTHFMVFFHPLNKWAETSKIIIGLSRACEHYCAGMFRSFYYYTSAGSSCCDCIYYVVVFSTSLPDVALSFIIWPSEYGLPIFKRIFLKLTYARNDLNFFISLCFIYCFIYFHWHTHLTFCIDGRQNADIFWV